MFIKRTIFSFLFVAQSLTFAASSYGADKSPATDASNISPEYKMCIKTAAEKAKPAGTVVQEISSDGKAYILEANSIFKPELNGDDPITRSLKVSIQKLKKNRTLIIVAATYGNRVDDDPTSSQEVVRYVTKGAFKTGKSSVEEGLAYAANATEPPYAAQLEVTSRGDKALRYAMECLAQITPHPTHPSTLAQTGTSQTTRTP